MRFGCVEASALATWTKFRFASFAVLLGLVCGLHAASAETKTVQHSSSPHRLYASRHHGAYAARRETVHHYYADYGYADYDRLYYLHEHYRRDRARLAHYSYHRRGWRYASAHYSYSRLQCVPYAREVSHIGLSGDAFLWWAEASGRYARGSVPVEGAVLNFRSIRRMPLGHVAVVTSVIDSRTILVTQANWVRGAITNDVTMQDVSPNNDWSEVEVELGDSSRWGAAYPTYGFIYNQPAGTMPGENMSVVASGAQGDEVAEAPRPQPIQSDAPDRNLQ